MPGFEIFGREEKKAIIDLLDNNGGVLFAHGFDNIRNGIYKVREFEKNFSDKLNIKYAQAVTSGSSAIKVGLKALGVKSGDEVITQSHTFVATVEAILECGAKPVIVDIDESLNMSPDAFENSITEKTKVVIPVHMAGVSAKMNEIKKIAKKYKIKILEDTAQACGGTFRGKYLGTLGDIGAFSFDAGKTLITGEGGMVITNNRKLYTQARAYHDHGHEYSQTKGRAIEKAIRTGFNYRMTEVQAAIGLVQLSKLDSLIKLQVNNKKIIKTALQNLPIRFREIPNPEGDIGDSVIFFTETKKQAIEIVKKLLENGIGTKNLPDALKWHFAKYWKHMFKEYNFYNDNKNHWKKSEKILSCAIAIPVMAKMGQKQQIKIIDTLVKIIKSCV